MRVALLANPWSGRGVGPQRAEAIAAALRDHGWHAEVHVGDSREATVAWGAAQAGQADRVVSVGGDGTLNAVMEGLTSSEPNDDRLPPVLQVGLGTANLLTHELGLPRKPTRLAEVVRAGVTQPFDLGQVHLQTAPNAPPSPRPTLLCWDFGLGAALMQAMDEVRTGPIRKSDYAGLLWKLLRTYQPTKQRVIADGEDLGEFEYGIVSGIRTYASAAFRFPPCAYDDGAWELYLLPRVSKRILAGMATRTLLKRLLKQPGLVHRRVRQVEITASEPAPVQIDGDWFGHTPVSFALSGRRLPILRPPAR